MKEKGQVVHIQGKEVTLKFLEHEGCKSCSSSFCNVKERAFTAHNEGGLSLDIGDIVTVELPTGKTIGASFMLLLFPLILFLVFYRISENLLSEPGEGLMILFGTIGLGIGFGITFVLRWMRRGRDYPVIIAKDRHAPSSEAG